MYLKLSRVYRMYLFSFVSLIGWISLFYNWRKRYAAYYPLLATTGLISILYVFGWLKILNWGSTFVFVIGLISFAKALFSLLSSPSKAIKKIKNLPASLIFFGVAGFAWYFFTLKATLFGSDEFFWGQFTKAIVDSNNFYTLKSAIFTPKMNYPPGIALYQYYFLHFSHYAESALYFSQGTIMLSALALIFDLIAKNLKNILSIGLAIACTTVYFGPGLLSLMNDQVLGTLFASTVLASFFVLRSNKSKLLLLSAILVLPLIKSTGTVLALTAVLAISLDLIITNSNLFRKREKRFNKAVFILIIVFGLTAILPLKSWDLYLKRQGGEATPPIPSINQIRNAFSDNASERQRLTIKNFKGALISMPMNQQEGEPVSDYPAYKLYLKATTAVSRPALPILAWLSIITLLLAATFYYQTSRERVSTLALYFSLLAGLSAFLLLHFITYLFYFSDYEAVNLASMNRYISAYFLALALVAIGSVAFFIKENPKKSAPLKTVAGAIFIYLLIFHTPPLTRLIVPPQMMAASTNAVREKTKEFSDYINAHTESTSKVWVIYQNTNGWECMMIRYDIAPRIMNTNNWSLGSKYGPNDVWTNALPAAEFVRLIQEDSYDYIFLAKVDENFWSHYEELFENPAEAKLHRLFKIQRTADNEISLIAQ